MARLAAENERSRIARDLHDLLGHSLTTITVKAGLANRLAGRDPDRAAKEIGEVEQLTRSALADVRAAVDGYRDVTLAGELASAQEVLRAAGQVAACSPKPCWVATTPRRSSTSPASGTGRIRQFLSRRQRSRRSRPGSRGTTED